jgi:LCP family protein required for cell wall assembly
MASWYGGSPRLVLVLGTDTRPGNDPLQNNSDSVHILAAAPATGQGSIVGIPRDTFVNTPYGLDKLAITSRDKGTGQPFGPGTTLETVRTLTGLPIEGYMTTGFAGFPALVDGFGGFNADLVYPVDFTGTELPAGPNFLNGKDALSTSRERMTYPSGDVDRQLNGGLLMKAALTKVQGQGIAKLLDNLALLDAFVFTDLSAADLLTLGAAALEMTNVSNVVVEGNVIFETLRGDVSFGFGMTPLNLTTFTDLADGIIDPGRCAVTLDAPMPPPACWQRP